MKNHPVPLKYHALFAIGRKDRRGNVIDFKTPPIVVDSQVPIHKYREVVFREHLPAEQLPMIYTASSSFIVLRPTALSRVQYIRTSLMRSGLHFSEEFQINNFMKFSDVLYTLDPDVSFHWKWRVIMRALHDHCLQDQNNAIVFTLQSNEDNQRVMNVKNRIRADIGETPFLLCYRGKPKIALGIHHLHSPDSGRLAIEYNVLMHARYKTSVFS